MTLVIADTGPVHYLVLIDVIEILPRLYDRILVPSAVRDELIHPNSPAAVRRWMETLPSWCEIRKVGSLEAPRGLGPGESEAIALAEEVMADLILLDDRSARTEALRRGLLVTGTIGVLVDAASHDLIHLPETLDRLAKTTFYASPELLAEILSEDAQRRERRRKNRDTPDR